MPPSIPPKGGSAPWDPRTGGGIPPTPLLRAGWPRRDRPPSCLRQGRGVAPRASRLLAYGKSGSSVPAAGREHANMHGKPTLSARLAAGRSWPFLGLAAGAASPTPPGRGLCPLAPRTGGSVPPPPLLRAGCVTARGKPARGRAGQAALLPTARAGGCTPGKPLSCLRQGQGVSTFVRWKHARVREWYTGLHA